MYVSWYTDVIGRTEAGMAEAADCFFSFLRKMSLTPQKDSFLAVGHTAPWRQFHIRMVYE
jgi:hypothetical protein